MLEAMGNRSKGVAQWAVLLGALAAVGACRKPPDWQRRAQALDARFPRPPKKGAHCLSDATLAQGLLAAVQSTGFAEVWDYGPLYGTGCPSEQAACLSQVGQVGPERFPQIDLSVAAFNPAGCAPAVAKATVVFDRAHPDGVIGHHDPRTLKLTDIRYRKWDEARFNSGRWRLSGEGAAAQAQLVPGSEVAWSAPFPEGSRLGPEPDGAAVDFMSPWPASVFKLMVATRLLQALEAGKTADGQPLTLATEVELPTQAIVSACPAEPRKLTLRQALETMLQWSGNCAAAGLIRFLHERQEIIQSPSVDESGWPLEGPRVTRVNELLASLGLETLQMNRTVAQSGRWGNPNDNYDTRTATVANNHMTSWDTVRLLWLLDDVSEAQRPAWEVAPGQPVNAGFVGPQTKALLRELLRDSFSGTGLANTLNCGGRRLGDPPGVTGDGLWPEMGIPQRYPAKWLDGIKVKNPWGDHPYPNVVDGLSPEAGHSPHSLDVSPCQRAAEVEFLNKAGLTNVAGSSVGIVRGLEPEGQRQRLRRHYIVSFFSSLGTRFADGARMKAVGLGRDAHAVTGIDMTQKIPALGAKLDTWLALWLE